MTTHIDKLYYNNYNINTEVDLLPITVLLGKPYLNINYEFEKMVDNFPISKMLSPEYYKEIYETLYMSTNFNNGIIIAPNFGHNWHHSNLYCLWDNIYNLVVNQNVQLIASTQSWDVIKHLALLMERNNVDRNESKLVLVARLDEQRKSFVKYEHEDIIVCAEQNIEMR